MKFDYIHELYQIYQLQNCFSSVDISLSNLLWYLLMYYNALYLNCQSSIMEISNWICFIEYQRQINKAVNDRNKSAIRDSKDEHVFTVYIIIQYDHNLIAFIKQKPGVSNTNIKC